MPLYQYTWTGWMKRYIITTKTITVILFTTIGLGIVSAHDRDITFMPKNENYVPMVFVQASTVHIGATLEEAVEKCEQIRSLNKSPGIGNCLNALSQSVPDGLRYFVTPLENVFVDDYFIDKYEVTMKSYQACVDYGNCNGDVIRYLQDYFPNISLNDPVHSISYSDANLYCQWRGGYIPSEAEWEYASRGSNSLAFPWGDQFIGDSLNFCDSNCQSLKNDLWNDGYEFSAPVTAHPLDISWVGAQGMAGNVSEWTSTIYSEPNVGPAIRVVKGGYYGSTADQVLLWRRFPLSENEIREGVGFRCAKHLEVREGDVQKALLILLLVLISTIHGN